MILLIIIVIVLIVVGYFDLIDDLREVKVHLRVLERLIDELKCQQNKK